MPKYANKMEKKKRKVFKSYSELAAMMVGEKTDFARTLFKSLVVFVIFVTLQNHSDLGIILYTRTTVHH